MERSEVNFGINFATFVFLKGIMAQTALPARRIKRKGKEWEREEKKEDTRGVGGESKGTVQVDKDGKCFSFLVTSLSLLTLSRLAEWSGAFSNRSRNGMVILDFPELLFCTFQTRCPQHSFISCVPGFVHSRTASSHIEVHVHVLLYPEPQRKVMESIFVSLLSCWSNSSQNCLTSGLASLLLGQIDLRLLIICIKLRTNERKLIYCFRLSFCTLQLVQIIESCLVLGFLVWTGSKFYSAMYKLSKYVEVLSLLWSQTNIWK